MRAMVLEQIGLPLVLKELPSPQPQAGQVLLKVSCCGICRTDLHVIDGELPDPTLPIIPGHQIVGTVVENGSGVSFPIGTRVGVPWLGGTCGHCPYCSSDRENLCNHPTYTGFSVNGGFAEFCVANAAYAFPLPSDYPDLQVAPLLCAGVIGYRTYRMAGNAKRIGIYGFGSAAHILTQLATWQQREIYAFTKDGDSKAQEFARSLGAVWAGGVSDVPPHLLEAVLIFAPAGDLIPKALEVVVKGGIVVCGGIYMSDIPAFPYSLLWEERSIKSVANLTRRDVEEFLQLAPQVPIRTHVTVYPLDQANQALDDLRSGRFVGSAVIQVE